MRSRPAAQSPRSSQLPGARDRPRRGRVAVLLVALASILLLVGACGSGSARSSSTAIGSSTGRPPNATHFTSGTGVVTRSGSGSGSHSGHRSTGSYSVAFAKCMRAHGLPRFPNPNGKGNELGPGSVVNPTSQAFQAAVNGPCKRLAPAGWVSAGPVTR